MGTLKCWTPNGDGCTIQVQARSDGLLHEMAPCGDVVVIATRYEQLCTFHGSVVSKLSAELLHGQGKILRHPDSKVER